MLFRRIYQFLIVYFIGILFLLAVKYTLSLSDYVIPGILLLAETSAAMSGSYLSDVMDTMSVTVLGQLVSILMAFGIGTAGRKSSWMGSLIKVTAYNIWRSKSGPLKTWARSPP